jgi:hypothetical protein
MLESVLIQWPEQNGSVGMLLNAAVEIEKIEKLWTPSPHPGHLERGCWGCKYMSSHGSYLLHMEIWSDHTYLLQTKLFHLP